MSFTDIDGYYLPAEVDAKFDEQQAEIGALRSRFAEEKKQSYLSGKAEAQAEIDEAVWLLDPNDTNELGALREWKRRYDAFMTKNRGE